MPKSSSHGAPPPLILVGDESLADGCDEDTSAGDGDGRHRDEGIGDSDGGDSDGGDSDGGDGSGGDGACGTLGAMTRSAIIGRRRW